MESKENSGGWGEFFSRPGEAHGGDECEGKAWFPGGGSSMRCLLYVPLCLAAAAAALWHGLETVPQPCDKDEAIFEPGAKLKVESGDGSGGEGPAWHPKLGLLTTGGKGDIMRLD